MSRTLSLVVPSSSSSSLRPIAALLLSVAFFTAPAAAQCPEEPVAQNWSGAGTVACPCFVVGEEAGAVLDVPASHYPIEILRIQVGWGSLFGGQPNSLESALHLYPAGLPDPGTAQFSIAGPVLTDGVINEFDIEPLAGNKIIASGPFTVTLEFANNSTLLGPAPVHDGTACQAGKNVINAIPGGWLDACAQGVTGDWLFGVVYRRVNCPITQCVEIAAWSNYGAGFPGTLGVPALTLDAPPVVGGSFQLLAGNSQGSNTVAAFFVGVTAIQVQGGWGGDLLVSPAFTIVLPLPGAGAAIPLSLADDPALCGATLRMQTLQADAGAAHGLASSAGLQLDLGS